MQAPVLSVPTKTPLKTNDAVSPVPVVTSRITAEPEDPSQLSLLRLLDASSDLEILKQITIRELEERCNIRVEFANAIAKISHSIEVKAVKSKLQVRHSKDLKAINETHIASEITRTCDNEKLARQEITMNAFLSTSALFSQNQVILSEFKLFEEKRSKQLLSELFFLRSLDISSDLEFLQLIMASELEERCNIQIEFSHSFAKLSHADEVEAVKSELQVVHSKDLQVMNHTHATAILNCQTQIAELQQVTQSIQLQECIVKEQLATSVIFYDEETEAKNIELEEEEKRAMIFVEFRTLLIQLIETKKNEALLRALRESYEKKLSTQEQIHNEDTERFELLLVQIKQTNDSRSLRYVSDLELALQAKNVEIEELSRKHMKKLEKIEEQFSEEMQASSGCRLFAMGIPMSVASGGIGKFVPPQPRKYMANIPKKNNTQEDDDNESVQSEEGGGGWETSAPVLSVPTKTPLKTNDAPSPVPVVTSRITAEPEDPELARRQESIREKAKAILAKRRIKEYASSDDEF